MAKLNHKSLSELQITTEIFIVDSRVPKVNPHFPWVDGEKSRQQGTQNHQSISKAFFKGII